MVVFISYSHDSDAHRKRVLGLSERLRDDGIETRLDQYANGTPPEGWPRWMLNQLDEARSVLVICTETYYRRFRGHEVPGRGKGADFEGALITQEIYDGRSRSVKFIPVLFAAEDEPSVPDPQRGQTFYLLNSEEGYQNLYDFLLGQAGLQPRAVGTLKRRDRRRGTPLSFHAETGIGQRSDLESGGRAQLLDVLKRSARGGLAAILVGIGLCVLSEFGTADRFAGALARVSYDLPFWLCGLTGTVTKLPEAVVIRIDDSTLNEEGGKLDANADGAVDREHHTALLERLERAGAKLVLFDFVFGTSNRTAHVDEALGRQINTMSNVILGGALRRSRLDDGTWTRQPTFPIASLLSERYPWGLLDLFVDCDFEARRLPVRLSNHPDHLSAAWRAAELLRLSVTQTTQGQQAEYWLRYYGPAGSAFTQMSYQSALDPRQVQDTAFTSRYIFVGDVSIGGHEAQRDEFPSPFGGAFLPGVEVHATAVMNLVRGDFLRRVPLLAQLGLVTAWGLGLAFASQNRAPVRS